MSYLVFARKWRPQKFEDVVAQDHVALTLKNAIKQNRMPHACLFTGPRGIGKTTTARILAKAMNCEKGPAPEPCNVCEACTDITSGRFEDVLEIDGASNRGIDEIRELRGNVSYAPARGEYKIYIIDEVHMLTNEAFNALLKTLEEPPSHVIFIFATTEPNKVPQTIISRCQRFDFRRISIERLISQIKFIAEKENIKLDQESMFFIAKKADGSMRDATSLLDQLVSYCGYEIKSEEVLKILGIIPQDFYSDLLKIVARKNSKEIYPYVERISACGYDYVEYMLGLVEFVRNLLVFKLDPKFRDIEVLPPEQRKSLNELEAGFSIGDLVRIMRISTETEQEIRRSYYARIIIEVAFLKMTMLSSTVELGSLLKKLEGGGSSAALATLSPAPARIPRISKANSGEVQRSEVEVKNQAEPAAFKVEPSVSSVKIPPAATSTPISVPISEVEVPSQQVSPEPETRVPDKDIVAAQVPSVSASTRLPESDDEKKKIITLVKDRWEDFIGVVHKKSVPLSFFLKECKPVAIENSILYLEFDPMHKFHSEQVNQTDNKEIIETEFLKLFGYQIRFKCTFKESSTQKIERVKLDSGQSQVFFSKEDSLAEINKNPVLKHLKEKLDAEVI